MSQKTFVYFIATADRSMVKIGCSGTPEYRLAGLAAWSPQPLNILAVVEGSYDDERALHARYLAHHSHKEWFNASPQMLADIAAIAHLGELPLSFKGKKGERNPLPRDNSVRSTPEWRAKVSEIHKNRWAREKRRNAIISRIGEYLFREKIDVAEINRRIGNPLVQQRADGSVYVYYGDEDLSKLEAFLRPANTAKAA